MNEENGIEIILDIAGAFRDKVTDDFTKQHITSRRYEITSAEDIPYVMPQMATDIEFQIEEMEPNKSGIVQFQIDKIRIAYDKFNPTRDGSFIDGYKTRKRVSTFRIIGQNIHV